MKGSRAVVAVMLVWAMAAGGVAVAGGSSVPVQGAATIVLPGPVDGQSLGFGSSAAEVGRLLGTPTRRALVKGREIWFWGLSRVQLENGSVVAWTRFDRPLPMNIGATKADALPVALGDTPQQLVDAKELLDDAESCFSLADMHADTSVVYWRRERDERAASPGGWKHPGMP